MNEIIINIAAFVTTFTSTITLVGIAMVEFKHKNHNFLAIISVGIVSMGMFSGGYFLILIGVDFDTDVTFRVLISFVSVLIAWLFIMVQRSESLKRINAESEMLLENQRRIRDEVAEISNNGGQ